VAADARMSLRGRGTAARRIHRRLAVTAARQGRDPGELNAKQSREFGEPIFDRVEAAAIPEQNAKLARLSPNQLRNVRFQIRCWLQLLIWINSKSCGST
jgi:phosphoglucomutase